MGYKRKRTIYRLRFEDAELEGLTVDMTGASVDEFLSITDLAGAVGVNFSTITPENLHEVKGAMELVDGLFETFAKHLVGWNLEEEDDSPVPATIEGVRSQDPEFILELVGAWLEAIGGVSDPKEPRSTSGAPSLVASLPMEPLSPSPSSSNEPSSSSAVASGSGAFQAS